MRYAFNRDHYTSIVSYRYRDNFDLSYPLSIENRIWYTVTALSQTIQNIAIVTMEGARRIGTRMRSTKWCHFQWPWTNSNPVFKVTPLFDAKCHTDGYRYGNSYYRRRIGNCTQAFEWHQFQWHWVTSNPDFKVSVKKTRKWYKIELYLQRPTNKKSHMVYRTVPFSMTLNNP